MDCTGWERYLKDGEITDAMTAEWVAHAESCVKCGKQYREIGNEKLDPRILRALLDKGCPEAGVLPTSEIVRRVLEAVRSDSPPG